MLSQRARIFTTAVFAAMIVAALRVFAEVPVDQPLAVHFSAAGDPDNWWPAWMALAFAPLMALGALALFLLLPKIDPRGANLLRSRRAVQAIFLAVLGLLAAIQLLLSAQAVGVALPVPRIMAVMAGLLFILVGNVMGKLRWNYTVGIRTPWTLADERVWDHTHRFAGRLFVAVGALVAVGVWWKPMLGHEAAAITTASVLVAVLSILRSYQLSREPRI